MGNRKAFTLLEVLISIALLGIILPALYESVDILRESNANLFQYVEKSKKITKATQTLYLDILSSDGNLTISRDDFSRLCIEQTKNTLYGLPSAKVCWVVLKKDHALLRVEGNGYTLPLKVDDRVEADLIMKDLELFDIYRAKDKVLVLMQQVKKEPISFMVQGITKPEKKKVKKKKKKIKKAIKNNEHNRTTSPDANKTVGSPDTNKTGSSEK
jgi:prepilin-type N-terminal cleavage/methylation domain-containing protein